MQDRVEVAELARLTVDGVIEQVRPEGETLVARLTVPEKPLTPVREMAVVVVVPVLKLRVVGEAFMVKSWTV